MLVLLFLGKGNTNGMELESVATNSDRVSMNSCQDLMEHDGMESRSFPDLLSPLAWFGLWNMLSYSCALCSCGGTSALKRTGGKLCCFDCLSSGTFGTLGMHFKCYVLRRCLFDKVIEYIFCIIFNMHNAWQSEFMSVLWV